MRIIRSSLQWIVLTPAVAGPVSLERLAARGGYRICEVCGLLGCSERYLYEVFSRDVGLAPKLWMRWERMVRARHMLSAGDDVAEVSEGLGFSSTGGFRREFLNTYGVRPVDYVYAEAGRR